MEHDAHLAEDVDQARPGARIISLVIVFAALFGIAGYIFFAGWALPRALQCGINRPVRSPLRTAPERGLKGLKLPRKGPFFRDRCMVSRV